MATYNLIRNSRVFFTTNVDATTGEIPTSGATITTANTQEFQVLDGFTFGQSTQQTTISLSEAGNSPTRGQRSFNTSLDPVEFSFSTYMRPSGDTTVTAEENVLWNALLANKAINQSGVQATAVTNFSRASSTTNVVTFTCAAVSLTGLNLGINDDVVTVSTIDSGSTNSISWNAPARVTILAGTTAAATQIQLTYLVAPGGSTTPSVAPTTVKLHRGAWVAHAAVTNQPAYALAHSAASNTNQLQKFGMYFLIDSIMYAVDNCALDQATVDFGLDGIATIQWTGKATALRQLPATAIITGAIGTNAVFSGTGNATGTASSINDTAHYITNKLSTTSIVAGIRGVNTTAYQLALTGGSITVANNINYITPANLGVVNEPIGYFTGSRSISGTLTAYLKTGNLNSAQILSDILTANASETKFQIEIVVGGTTNTVKVSFLMDGCALQVPTIETGDIMSTTINFTAQGFDPILATNAYDLEQTNDLYIKYYSV